MDHVGSPTDVGRSMSKLIAAFFIVVAGCAMEVPSPAVRSTPTSTTLALFATGLGPCTMQWYISCNYGIRVEGPGGYVITYAETERS